MSVFKWLAAEGMSILAVLQLFGKCCCSWLVNCQWCCQSLMVDTWWNDLPGTWQHLSTSCKLYRIRLMWWVYKMFTVILLYMVLLIRCFLMMFVFILCPDACNFVPLCSKLVHVLNDKLILNLESNNKVSSTITKQYLKMNNTLLIVYEGR